MRTKVAFEFVNNQFTDMFLCYHEIFIPEFVYPERPKRGHQNTRLFPKYTHIFELTEAQKEYIYAHRNDYTLENNVLVGINGDRFEAIETLRCDWESVAIVDEEGKFVQHVAIFPDTDEIKNNMILEPLPYGMRNPVWDFDLSCWKDGVEVPFEPKPNLESLQKENEELKNRLENMGKGILNVLDLM